MIGPTEVYVGGWVGEDISFKFCSFLVQHEVFGVERLTLYFKVENLEQVRAEKTNPTNSAAD